MTKDRVAIVTGASRGIGAAIALRLASDGWAVSLAARSEDDLARVAEQCSEVGGEGLPIPTDVTDVASLDALVAATTAKYGRVDALVNNAGLLPPARRTEKISPDEWRDVFDLTVTAPWYLACRAQDAMGDDGGAIVNVASTAAFFPSIGLSAYNAAKAALVMLTKSLGLEWAAKGIRVNAIAPGKVDTELVKPITEYSERQGLALNPMDRMASPEDVAALVSYLLGPEAAYMTGAVITFDGGEVLAPNQRR